MAKFYCTFHYDYRGCGPFIVHEYDSCLVQYDCRTGSWNNSGKLINAIPPGQWRGQETSVYTDEENMFFTPGAGWKYRWWRLISGEWTWTRYLIHPSHHGTLGCITPIGTDAIELRKILDKITLEQEYCPLTITKEI